MSIKNLTIEVFFRLLYKVSIPFILIELLELRFMLVFSKRARLYIKYVWNFGTLHAQMIIIKGVFFQNTMPLALI